MATQIEEQLSPPSPPLDVGESVILRIGDNELRATVVEDFGARTLDGGRILRIRVDLGEGVETEHDALEAELSRTG